MEAERCKHIQGSYNVRKACHVPSATAPGLESTVKTAERRRTWYAQLFYSRWRD